MAMNETEKILRQGVYEELLTEAQIREKVKELGKRISEDYREKCPILIGVLNGGFIFMADLIRELDINCEVDFIKLSSYGDSTQSSGKIEMLKDIDCRVEGRDILIVEDIVDSGRSVKFLRRRFSRLNPKSLKFVSLLLKEESAQVEFEIDYLGFSIPDCFVVGYGLDYAQKFRNLPSIYVMS